MTRNLYHEGIFIYFLFDLVLLSHGLVCNNGHSISLEGGKYSVGGISC